MSGRVIRVAPRRVREPDPAPVAAALNPEMAAQPSAPMLPAADAPPPAPVAAPPVVSLDTTELVKQLSANNDLLRQVLAELKRKKKWRFDLVRDQLGRPSQIDANEA